MFAHVTQYAYQRYVPYISERDAVTREGFEKSKLAEWYMLDTSLVYQNGQPNPNHIFDLFGSLSSHSATDVRFYSKWYCSRCRFLSMHQLCLSGNEKHGLHTVGDESVIGINVCGWTGSIFVKLVVQTTYSCDNSEQVMVNPALKHPDNWRNSSEHDKTLYSSLKRVFGIVSSLGWNQFPVS